MLAALGVQSILVIIVSILVVAFLGRGLNTVQ